MADRTLFDEIVDGNIPSYKVWEDDQYLAFLTPFASTPGATVVIPKENPGGYVFDVSDEAVAALMIAAKKAAKLLEKAFDTERVAVVFEGEAVLHLHAKLYPMHELTADRSKFPKPEVFFPVYPGYIMTASGPKLSDEALQATADKIKKAADNEN
jgi:diadenosine tetraphosphate (Ap4A) HIT family hydrolase